MTATTADGRIDPRGRSRRVSVAAALIGGGALVTIGAWSAVLTPQTSVDEAKSGTMNLGSTSTVATPPSAPAIEEAVPAIKGPAPLWAGESP